jgi:hypothetical protein
MSSPPKSRTRRSLALALSIVVFGIGLVARAQTPTLTTPAPRPTPSPITKITGTLECGKPEITKMEVGDAPHHVLSLGEEPCRWTKGVKLGRLKISRGESRMMRDERGDTAAIRGYHVGRAINGDAYFFRFDGQVQIRTDLPDLLHGRWAFTGGTGELAGLEGKGSFKGVQGTDGTTKLEFEGEYRLP